MKMKGAFAKLSEMTTGTDEEAQASSSSASSEPAEKKAAPAALGKAAAAFGKKAATPAGGDAWGAALGAAGVAPPKGITIGDEKASRWSAVKRELVEAGVGTGEGDGGGLSETQKEILAMGKEAWVKKVEAVRTIRKMSGAVAIAMSFGTTYYAAEIFVIVDHSTEKPRLVRLLVFATVLWAGVTLLFLLRQCATAERNDAMLRRAKRALDDRDARRAAAERRA